MVTENQMRGSEVIEILGKEMYKNFSIDNGYEVYKQVYEKFISGLNPENKDKGILIIGNIGVGKSAMMKIFHRMFKDTIRKFRWVNAYTLRDMVSEYSVSEIKEIYGKNCLCDLYIDDIGVSFAQKEYGNTINIISEIIVERYDLFISTGYRTHISSNLLTTIENNTNNIPTIELVYSERILDRIKEMCDLIIWEGKSLRK